MKISIVLDSAPSLSLSLSLSPPLSFDVVPLPCLAPLALLLPLTSLPEITRPRKVRKPESVRASSTADEALEEWAGVVKTWIPYLTGSRTGERTFASPSASSFWVKEWLGILGAIVSGKFDGIACFPWFFLRTSKRFNGRNVAALNPIYILDRWLIRKYISSLLFLLHLFYRLFSRDWIIRIGI